MDKAARTAIIRILAAMTDDEFVELTTQTRGGEWEPGPGDYRQLALELEGETRDKAKDAADQALRDHLHG